MASYLPVGLLTPASWVAMAAQRYLHVTGATSEDLGRVAVADRKHAATNPKAWFYEQPITLEEHQASRWIVEPLHLLDCCQETDGGQALVVTSLERARDLPHRRRWSSGRRHRARAPGQDMMTSYYRDDLLGLPEMAVVARQLWETSGLGPDDMQAAILYDHFTPYVLYQLEELGFCAKGEAKDFVRDGRLELGGALPINTHGGQLGEAYLHGMNGIAEGVRLVRGTSVNQVDGPRARRGHGGDRRADQRAGARRRSLRSLAAPKVSELGERIHYWNTLHFSGPVLPSPERRRNGPRHRRRGRATHGIRHLQRRVRAAPVRRAARSVGRARPHHGRGGLHRGGRQGRLQVHLGLRAPLPDRVLAPVGLRVVPGLRRRQDEQHPHRLGHLQHHAAGEPSRPASPSGWPCSTTSPRVASSSAPAAARPRPSRRASGSRTPSSPARWWPRPCRRSCACGRTRTTATTASSSPCRPATCCPSPTPSPTRPSGWRPGARRTFDLAAELGVGVLCFGFSTPDQLTPLVSRYKEKIEDCTEPGGRLREQQRDDHDADDLHGGRRQGAQDLPRGGLELPPEPRVPLSRHLPQASGHPRVARHHPRHGRRHARRRHRLGRHRDRHARRGGQGRSSSYVATGADQLSFGMLSTSMSIESCQEAVETFGKHVLKDFDKDPEHLTTKQRLAAGGRVGAASARSQPEVAGAQPAVDLLGHVGRPALAANRPGGVPRRRGSRIASTGRRRRRHRPAHRRGAGSILRSCTRCCTTAIGARSTA